MALSGGDLNITGGRALTASGLVTAQGGLTVSSGALTVSGGGVTLSGGDVNITGGRALTVAGPVTAQEGLTISSGTLTFPAITTRTTGKAGDPGPIITSRLIPATQCGGVAVDNPGGNDQERSEFILFHCNDGVGSYGPDFITLRAPAIRLQTYSDGGVTTIANDAGNVDSLYVAPNGRVGIGTGTTTSTNNAYPNAPAAQLEVKAPTSTVGLSVTGNNATAVNVQCASGKSGLVVANSSNTTLLRLDDNGRLGLGLGATAPAATLDVKAVSGTSGLQVKSSSGSTMLQVTDSGVTVSNGLLTATKGLTASGGPVSVMCSWQTKSVSTSYTAATDGFVLASIQTNKDDSSGTIYGYSDNMSTSIAMASTQYNDGGGTNVYLISNSFLMPVKKGAQWKVTTSSSNRGTVNALVSWMPLGQS